MSSHFSTRRPVKIRAPRTPTVGRVVDYYAPAASTVSMVARPSRATILEVVDAEEGLMRLQVVDPYNSFMTLEARFSEKPRPGHWSWPPPRR